MTTTKVIYVMAMVVPGGLAVLALAFALRYWMQRPASVPAAVH